MICNQQRRLPVIQSAMNSSLPTLILIIAVITASGLAEEVYYVTPNATTTCPPIARPGACQTLRQYVIKSEEYFQSDTTFYFLSGTHWLDIPEPVTILGRSRLKMIGDSRLTPLAQIRLEPSAVISCNSSASGFVFGFVQSLQIANLSFMHCGADISKVAALCFQIYQRNFMLRILPLHWAFLQLRIFTCLVF